MSEFSTTDIDFVDVNELIEVGGESVWCEGGFFRFTEERGVEELEEAGGVEQWVGASFGGEGDGGLSFEDFAVVVGELPSGSLPRSGGRW